MHLTGLILRSSLSFDERDELLASIGQLRPYEVTDLITHLEMAQLDLTQLAVYTKTDINKRLDYIEKKENM